LRDPDSFNVEDRRFHFPEKVNLAQALAGPGLNDQVWEILRKFNQTRNAIAHRKKKDPQEKFNDLRAAVTSALPECPVSDNTQIMMGAVKICT
jgi:hypothetical protein